MPVSPSRRFGAHMPTSGGFHNALYTGRDAGCEVVQIFTKSPQQWKAREITDEDVDRFLAAQDETGIPCVAAHNTYLINPCAHDPEILSKGRQALADEMVRASRLHIPYLVIHCGTPGDCSEEEGLQRIGESVRHALEQASADGTILLLETMAGQGKCLGHRFEHLARMLELIDGGERVHVCLDTCHIFAAGYDLRGPDAYADTMTQFDRTVGLEHIKLIHANDSKKDLGSRVDRHEHIGQGFIGADGFRHLLQDPLLTNVPVVLETPKEGEMDPVNLAALRDAAGIS